MDPFASAREAIAQLADTYGQDHDAMNEATTRLRVIDRVLMDGLGWRPADITSEESGPEGYVDYALGRPKRLVIVEAKREGIYFAVPAGLSGRRMIDIGTLTEDPRTRAAIEQVATYCQARGVPIALITNGLQYIAFYASRQDGVAPSQGQALCFHSLQEMRDNFSDAWALLSREGLAQRNLHRLLSVGNKAGSAPPKLSNSIANYPGFRSRSNLETNLRLLGNAFVRDIENPLAVTDEFYRQCYCNTGALSQYALVSREVLLDRYGSTALETGLEMAPVREKRGKLNPLLQGDLFSVMKTSPLIILGDVGVGKTMFLQHFIRIDGAEALERSLVFYVDFGSKKSLTESFEAFVQNQIEEQLLERYQRDIREAAFVRAVYNREVNQFARGVFGTLKSEDPTTFRLKEAERLDELVRSDDHLLRALKHLNREFTLVVVLDNIDQWSISDQDRVFLIAQSLAAQWPVAVFVSLRPETFHQSRASGALSAYHLRVFTVSPPRVSDVIHRRIEYARTVAAEQSEKVPDALQISMEDLRDYLDMLDQSFLGSPELCDIVDNLSGGNVRNALTMIARFIGSPYVSTVRILDEARNGGRYVVPPHELLRATLYGDHAYYDPTRTEIPNVFDISTSDAREHFLLSAIVARCQEGDGSRRGFVEVEDIYSSLTALGFTQEQIGFHLKRAIGLRLLNAVGDEEAGPFRANQLGAYAVLRLPAFFTYMDAIVVDTPIVDTSARKSILDVRSIEERLDRVRLFRQYLDDRWRTIGGRALGKYDWGSISSALAKDVEDAAWRVQRARERSEA